MHTTNYTTPDVAISSTNVFHNDIHNKRIKLTQYMCPEIKTETYITNLDHMYLIHIHINNNNPRIKTIHTQSTTHAHTHHITIHTTQYKHTTKLQTQPHNTQIKNILQQHNPNITDKHMVQIQNKAHKTQHTKHCQSNQIRNNIIYHLHNTQYTKCTTNTNATHSTTHTTQLHKLFHH